MNLDVVRPNMAGDPSHDEESVKVSITSTALRLRALGDGNVADAVGRMVVVAENGSTTMQESQ